MLIKHSKFNLLDVFLVCKIVSMVSFWVYTLFGSTKDPTNVLGPLKAPMFNFKGVSDQLIHRLKMIILHYKLREISVTKKWLSLSLITVGWRWGCRRETNGNCHIIVAQVHNLSIINTEVMVELRIKNDPFGV